MPAGGLAGRAGSWQLVGIGATTLLALGGPVGGLPLERLGACLGRSLGPLGGALQQVFQTQVDHPGPAAAG